MPDLNYKPTLGSLFAGIGGIDLGFERAGFKTEWQVEIDPYASRVLAKHWPHVRRHDDVKTFPVGNPDDWRVDCIAGGFPCQDISYAGKGAGIAEGTRSGLWSEFARIIRLLRPRIVVVENVPALLTRGINRVLGDLAASGYDAEWDCISAEALGAPHKRDRVFIVANSDRSGSHLRSWIPEQQRQGLSDADGSGWGCTDEGRKIFAIADASSIGREDGSRMLSGIHRPKTRDGQRKTSGDCSRRPGGHQWDIEPSVGRVADGVPRRVDRLKGLGNAVVPQVAEWIARRIIQALPEQVVK